MDKKIKGFVGSDAAMDPEYGGIRLSEHFRPILSDTEATLVVHSGPHEKVYTESEVRALLKEVIDNRGGTHGLTVHEIALNYGITL